MPSYDHTPFAFDDLEECLDFAIIYEEAHGNRQIRDYCSSMVTRLKSLKDREEYAFLRYSNAEVATAPSSIRFLSQLLGLKDEGASVTKKDQIVILDMNDVEDEVVELVSSVTARMLFKLLRRADPRNRFPIHLLLEEAHRYIGATPSRYAVDATKGFERIAKEGRKYGMFVLLASQRPTDIKEWLAENGPRDYAELVELRKSLYSRRTHGQFVVKHHGETLAGEERFTVTGRESPLLIVSNKSRHYLLRTLCRMVKGR